MDQIDRIDRRLYGSGVAEPAEGADLLGEGDEMTGQGEGGAPSPGKHEATRGKMNGTNRLLPRLTSVVSIYMNTTYGRPNL